MNFLKEPLFSENFISLKKINIFILLKNTLNMIINIEDIYFLLILLFKIYLLKNKLKIFYIIQKI